MAKSNTWPGRYGFDHVIRPPFLEVADPIVATCANEVCVQGTIVPHRRDSTATAYIRLPALMVTPISFFEVLADALSCPARGPVALAIG